MTISVPFFEHEDSPIEGGSFGGKLNFSRIFVCAYVDRFTFLRDLSRGGIAGLPMSYNVAWPHLRASSFDIERATNNIMGASAGIVLTDPERDWITHDTIAIITVDYEPIEFNQDDPQNGTWATYNRGAMSELQVHPGRGMRWSQSDTPLPRDVEPGVPVPAVRHEVTWHQVRNIPEAQLRALLGTVNGTDFYIPASQQTVPAGHLYFSESNARTTLDFDGNRTNELTLVYLEKHQMAFISGGQSYGWNYLWNPGEQLYDMPIAEDGSPMFPETDLSSLYT